MALSIYASGVLGSALCALCGSLAAKLLRLCTHAVTPTMHCCWHDGRRCATQFCGVPTWFQTSPVHMQCVQGAVQQVGESQASMKLCVAASHSPYSVPTT